MTTTTETHNSRIPEPREQARRQSLNSDSQHPTPKASTPGHTQSYGSEMSSHVVDGAMIGAGLGFVIGICVYLLMTTGLLPTGGFEVFLERFPVLTAVFVILLPTLFCAGGGATVGVGTPKIKDRPQQGWVRNWRTLVFNRRHHTKELHVPQFKNVDVEEHRQNQRG